METLENLSKFVETYPQVESGKRNYVFTGGTAVRLNQELANSSDRRPITDFDILVLNNKNYPTHQFKLGNTDLDFLPKEKLEYFIESYKINEKDYHFLDGTYLTLTKTCSLDCPREKDFEDISILYNLNLIDFDKLKTLYSKFDKVTNNVLLVEANLKWLLDSDFEEHPNRIHLFNSFLPFVNFIDEFSNPELVKNYLEDFVEEYQGNGEAVSSVIYNIHSIIREGRDFSEEKKLNLTDNLLSIAGLSDYRDFDRRVQFDILPKLRYSKEEFDILSACN